MNLKENLYNQCVLYVSKRHSTIENTISSHQKALSSETKSSAGDKHETGRAMLQLEMEKASQQISVVEKMKAILSKINVADSSPIIKLGSLVETNLGTYFISISLGQIFIEQKPYFVISTSSPIGQQLLAKKAGDSIFWNGKEINIYKVS